MAVNGAVSQTSFNAIGTILKKVDIQQLRDALNKLDGLKGNVQNCNCSPSNCCQSSVCQSCQAQCNCNCSNCTNCSNSH